MATRRPAATATTDDDEVVSEIAGRRALERDRFAASVAIDGDTVIVGATADDDRGEDSGSAYIFRLSDGNWQQAAKLTAGDGGADGVT